MNDRRRGALIGLAVGDALGAAVEFRPPGSFVPVTGYRNGGPHRLDAGEWTDDTSMALALADSISAVGWDLNDQANRYVEWWQTGKYSVNGRCFDIGITTRNALSHFTARKNALASGDRSDRASGNGSIMRLAPVPIRFAPGDVKLPLTVFLGHPGFGFFIPTGFQQLALGRGFRAPRELSKFPPTPKGS